MRAGIGLAIVYASARERADRAARSVGQCLFDAGLRQVAGRASPAGFARHAAVGRDSNDLFRAPRGAGATAREVSIALGSRRSPVADARSPGPGWRGSRAVLFLA